MTSWWDVLENYSTNIASRRQLKNKFHDFSFFSKQIRASLEAPEHIKTEGNGNMKETLTSSVSSGCLYIKIKQEFILQWK